LAAPFFNHPVKKCSGHYDHEFEGINNMNGWRKIRTGFRSLFRKEELDREMDEEMRAHIELRTQANLEAGLPPEEARHAALRSFGGMEQAKEVCRDLRGVGWIETAWRDARVGCRVLRKNPGFTAVAVVTLALGIGANTAIFSIINALFLKSLPGVKSPHELVLVTDRGGASLPCAIYEYARDHTNSQSLSGLCAAANSTEKRRLVVAGSTASEAEPVCTHAVSGDFFSVLGVPAVLGRALTPEDDRPGNPQAVAVLSYGFWQRRFGLHPAVIGQAITLNDVPFTIVGVAPREFSGAMVEGRPDLWWPMHMIPRLDGEGWAGNFTNPTAQWVHIFGRLKPGVTPGQARAELDLSYQEMLNQTMSGFAHSESERREFLNHRIELRPGFIGYSNLQCQFQKPLYLLLTAASLVLLVACANLAGLLLARSSARQRELSVRAALGASRFTLIRQLGTESLLLAVMGGMIGLVFCQWAALLLASYLPGYGNAVTLDLAPDLRILGFTFGLSLITGLCFGLLPALQGSRMDLATAIKEQAGSLLTRESGQRWNQALVVSQIALSCCLLIGAGLFVRTVQKLKALDVGFHRENLLVFEINMGKRYDNARQLALYLEILRRLEALPGVQSASFSSLRSMSGSERGWGPWKVAPDGLGWSDDQGFNVRGTGVGPRYFETLQIPVLAGRTFGPQDVAAARAGGDKPATIPVVIDQTSARRLFGEENALGKRLRAVGFSWPPLEVIGVVGDVTHKKLRSGLRISIYGLAGPRNCPFFYIRSVVSPLAAAGAIRELMRDLDLEVEMSHLQTMNDLVNEQLLQERTISHLAGLFSLLALAVACLGLYGILSYGVVRRTREIGVRMALGAQTRDVLALVIRQGVALAMMGCALGIMLALGLARFVSSLLFGVSAIDPVTFAVAAVALMLSALLACFVPTRRAVRVDPMVALRYE
jgi:predicted permease